MVIGKENYPGGFRARIMGVVFDYTYLYLGRLVQTEN